MMAALHSFWRRHRSTVLRSLLLVALLHRLNFLAFLAASSPVWLLTAFLLGAVLVHSEPNVPLAAASEDEDRHLYKKIRHLAAGSSSSSSSSSDAESSVTSMEEHLVVGDKDEPVAWTADDERSIQSIGSLELERDARLEKLMSRRSIHRSLIDLDVHIPAVLAPRSKNPFDLHHRSCSSSSSSSYYDDPGSAPSSLLGHHTNPFDIRQRDPDGERESERKAAAMLRRHETFTASAAPPARPSRFRPYFVADVQEGAGGAGAGAGSDNSNSSSSPSSSAGSDHQTQQQQQQAVVVGVEEAAATTSTPRKWDGNGNGMLEAVDVELISDSSDDDMSLPGEDAAGSLNNNTREHSDEEDSFEVESITQQVAAVKQQQQQQPPPRVTAVEPLSSPSGQQQQHDEDASSKEWVAPTTLASVEENEKRERELSEIREHHILGPVPVIDSSSAASSGAGAGAARAMVAPPLAAAQPAAMPRAAAPAPPAAAAATSGKPSSKSKASSKKPVFGFFRK